MKRLIFSLLAGLALVGCTAAKPSTTAPALVPYDHKGDSSYWVNKAKFSEPIRYTARDPHAARVSTSLPASLGVNLNALAYWSQFNPKTDFAYIIGGNYGYWDSGSSAAATNAQGLPTAAGTAYLWPSALSDWGNITVTVTWTGNGTLKFAGKNVTAGVYVYHDSDYSPSQGGTGRTATTGVLHLGVMFA